MSINVGVGVGNTKMGGRKRIPRVDVGVEVGMFVGEAGVGGAAMMGKRVGNTRGIGDRPRDPRMSTFSTRELNVPPCAVGILS